MKYTKREREQAALICQLAASNHLGHRGVVAQADINVIRAANLARCAFYACFYTSHTWCEQNAEAEALLRTGWTP